MIAYDDRSNCKRARLHYYDLLDTETAAEVPDDVRRHVAACRHCQADMSRLEALLADTDRNSDSEQRRRDSAVSKLLSLHFAWIDKPVTCKSTKPFLASLADPLLRIVIPTPITVHIDKCRRCAEELSTIKNSGFSHKELCRLGRAMAVEPAEDLAERDDLGIVTCFTFREQGDRSTETESNEMYAGWPIDVRVLSQVEVKDSYTAETAGSSAPTRGALILNLKRHIRPVIATAAVIMIGLALFLGTSPARAVDPEQIRGVLMSATNIHVTNFIAGKTEPEREEWVSRSLNVRMLKVGQEATLWDFRSGSRKLKSFGGDAPEEVQLTSADVEAARVRIDSPLDIVPSGIPGDARWVLDDTFQSDTQDCDVYELAWTARTMPGEATLRKWRVFVEPGTNLPLKAQFLSKSPADAEYVLWNELIVEYPDDQQVETALKREAFL